MKNSQDRALSAPKKKKKKINKKKKKPSYPNTVILAFQDKGREGVVIEKESLCYMRSRKPTLIDTRFPNSWVKQGEKKKTK